MAGQRYSYDSPKLILSQFSGSVDKLLFFLCAEDLVTWRSLFFVWATTEIYLPALASELAEQKCESGNDHFSLISTFETLGLI